MHRGQLFIACERGVDDVIGVLMSNGTDPDVSDNAGKTPLHVAVTCAHVPSVYRMVRLILAAPGGPNGAGVDHKGAVMAPLIPTSYPHPCYAVMLPSVACGDVSFGVEELILRVPVRVFPADCGAVIYVDCSLISPNLSSLLLPRAALTGDAPGIVKSRIARVDNEGLTPLHAWADRVARQGASATGAFSITGMCVGLNAARQQLQTFSRISQ
jgi:ankyrin repeat protein